MKVLKMLETPVCKRPSETAACGLRKHSPNECFVEMHAG